MKSHLQAGFAVRSARSSRKAISGQLSGPAVRSGIAMGLLLVAGGAFAFSVPDPLTLADLVSTSEVIFAATSVDSKPAENTTFAALAGYEVRSTRMAIIRCLKGGPLPSVILLDHYAPTYPDDRQRNYAFRPGRSYLVFARRPEHEGNYRQLFGSPLSEGGLPLTESEPPTREADEEQPASWADIRTQVWHNLTGLLRSHDPLDAALSVRLLNCMSGGNFVSGGGRCKLSDFDRVLVLQAVSPLLMSGDADILAAAIEVFSQEGPLTNEAARAYATELAAVADGAPTVLLRAKAVRALGRACRDDVRSNLDRWAKDPEPPLRQAAVLVLSDYEDSAALIANATRDHSAMVREAAALAIGVRQRTDTIPYLEALLRDPETSVRIASARSLITFKHPEAERVLKEHVANEEFGMLFVVVLARNDPAPYLKELATIAGMKRTWGICDGRILNAQAWDILFAYAARQLPAELVEGRHDAVLEALEAADFWDSSSPRDLYAFYKKHGMDQRALSFRKKAVSRSSLSRLDYFFDDVDKRERSTEPVPGIRAGADSSQ